MYRADVRCSCERAREIEPGTAMLPASLPATLLAVCLLVFQVPAPLRVESASASTRNLTRADPGFDIENIAEPHGDNPAKLRREKRQVPNTPPAVGATTTTNATTHAPQVPQATEAPFQWSAGTSGFFCNTDLYIKYGKRCCGLPENLIDNYVITKCSRQYTNPDIRYRSSGRKPGMKFLINNYGWSAKNYSIKGNINQICITHCVFKELRWHMPYLLTLEECRFQWRLPVVATRSGQLNEENLIDESYMISSLQITMPTEFRTPLTYFLYYTDYICKNLITPGVVDVHQKVINFQGKKCYITPSKYFRCFRKYLYLNCPNIISNDKQCQLDLNTLKTCDNQML